MPKTVAEARAALLAKGYEGEPTPEALAQEGWSPDDPLLGIEIAAPVRTQEQIRDDAALMLQEAKENNVPAVIYDIMKRFAGVAIKAAGSAIPGGSVITNGLGSIIS